MKVLDVLIFILLFSLVGIGSYILWLNFPSGETKYENYLREISLELNDSDMQFYPNMRYRDRTISYRISDSCNLNRKQDTENSFNILTEETILEFVSVDDLAEIEILCSDIAPEPEEEGHFVAGEGGPSEIINVSNYAVIFSGRVSLYRENNCNKPNVALHEILHALGFDHNDNSKSIMFPLTKCDQELDNYIINEINRLYIADSRPDLVVEKVTANRTGRYLNFDVEIGNFGLKDSRGARLVVYVGKEFIKSFDLEDIEIGTRKILGVENLRVPRKSDVITFIVESFEQELNDKNNVAEIKLVAG